MPHNPTVFSRILEASMPEPNSGCWIWLGSLDGHGYGKLSINNRTARAHRASWAAVHGSIARRGLFVCHKCDNRCCVNPDHLFLGTAADNTADMVRKGRKYVSKDPRPYHQGSNNPNSRVSEDVVRAILLSPLNQRDAAKDFGVAPSWVQRIRKREVWRHVEVPAHLLPKRKFYLKKKTRERLAQTPCPDTTAAGGERDGCPRQPSHRLPANHQREAA